MEITYLMNLKSFKRVGDWQRWLKEENSTDETDTLLLEVFAGYRTELRYRLALAEPYSDDLDRLATVKSLVRSMNPLFDQIAEASTCDEADPGAVKAVLDFIRDIVIDLAWVIRMIEEDHPELTWMFTQERADYARIHEQWRREDEAEQS